MYQVFGTIIIILSGACYWLYSDNNTLKANQVKLEYAIEEQKAAFNTMKESYEKQGQALNNLQRANAEIEAEKDRYLDIFRKHNLDHGSEATFVITNDNICHKRRARKHVKHRHDEHGLGNGHGTVNMNVATRPNLNVIDGDRAKGQQEKNQ